MTSGEQNSCYTPKPMFACLTSLLGFVKLMLKFISTILLQPRRKTKMMEQKSRTSQSSSLTCVSLGEGLQIALDAESLQFQWIFNTQIYNPLDRRRGLEKGALIQLRRSLARAQSEILRALETDFPWRAATSVDLASRRDQHGWGLQRLHRQI